MRSVMITGHFSPQKTLQNWGKNAKKPNAMLAKEEGRARESPRMEEKEKRGLYVRSISQTKDVNPKGDQCPHAHPRKTGKCLRCGATGHDLASCRRPARDPKTKGSPPPQKGQGRGKGKAKAKPKPKAKAQAHERHCSTRRCKCSMGT